MNNSMKKAFYYNFLPTKKEELAALSINRPYQVTRILVEIQDMDPSPGSALDPGNPWRIRKVLETHEAATGKIHLTHEQVFEHVFRWYPLENANLVVMGNKICVSVCDVTDHNQPVLYGPNDDQTFSEKGLQDGYVLGLNMQLVRSRGFKKDDEVAIYFDPRTQIFYFKVFRD